MKKELPGWYWIAFIIPALLAFVTLSGVDSGHLGWLWLSVPLFAGSTVFGYEFIAQRFAESIGFILVGFMLIGYILMLISFTHK